MLRNVLWVAMAFGACVWAQPPYGYTITTVAGNGTAGFAGDGSAAKDAQINGPSSLALDSQGNLYISDQLNQRVRKITGTTISTVAGNGQVGYAGDNAAATSASFQYPQSIALDATGNIYITDSLNSRVRKVVTSGNVSTIAGRDYAAFDGDGGLATDAHIFMPLGVTVDAAGNIYFTDAGNLRVRKIGTDGKINTFAGNGSKGIDGDGVDAKTAFLGGPTALGRDSAGNVYICDTENGMIRKVDTNGIITTFAGTGTNGFSGDGGPARSAMLNHPKAVAVDANGLVYIADTYNGRIRVVSKNGTISTIAGQTAMGESVTEGDPALTAILNFPAALAVTSDGRVYVGDSQNNKIRLLTPTVPPAPTTAPAITAGGVITAGAYGAAPSAAPGSWIEIFGTNFSTASRQWAASEFTGTRGPTTLDGTRVTIGGKSAYVAFVSPGQVNAQVPSDVGTGPQAVTVTTAAGTSNSVNITVNTTQPGVLSTASAGKQYAVGILPDGRYAFPFGALSVSTRPAKPGEIVTFYGVGFGPVSPSVSAGDITPSAARLTNSLQVLFGSTPATVSYAGLAPGTVGLYQFNVVVPQVADNDSTPVSFTLAGAAAPQTLVVAVRR